MFCKKGPVKNFANFLGKHLFQTPFYNKVAGIRLATHDERAFDKGFPVNFAKFSRKAFLGKISRGCLQSITDSTIKACAEVCIKNPFKHLR